MNRFEILVEQCDRDIRHGRPQDAAKRLVKMRRARVPREWRLPLAKISRRAGLFSLGLRLLSRLINPTPAESAEYAVLLLRSGAVNEALERLIHLDSEQVPDALLFRAYAHFARWEYQEAIAPLEKYVQARLSPNAELVGRTNLAFALVECRESERAHALLAENIRLAQEQKNLNLESFNRAARTQAFVQDQQYSQARREIDFAKPNSAGVSHDQFFIQKWDLILQGLETKSLDPFVKLRKLAGQKHDWFALRDADLFSLKVDFKQERFLHIFFGSPFEGFRETIRRELGFIPDRQVYVLGPKNSPRFDLASGKLNDQQVIRAGGKCHQLLEILLRDFYQPSRIAGLFSALFPAEKFSITTSPDRVRQIIRRTRQWMKTEGLPIFVEERSGFYSLGFRAPFSFRISLNRTSVDLYRLQIEKLRSLFSAKVFSTQDICEVADLSTTSAHRLIRLAIDAGEVERLGPVKRPIGYRFTNEDRRDGVAAA